jgi:hypothetical protein
MAEDEEQWRLFLATKFAVGVDENNRVMLKFDYENVPTDAKNLQLGLSLPPAIARELAKLILSSADKAEAATRH